MEVKKMTIQNNDQQQSNQFNPTLSHYRVTSSPAVAHTHQTAVALLTEPRLYDGYMNGNRQPSALITLQFSAVSALQRQHLQEAYNYYFAKYTAKTMLQSVDDVVASFVESVCLLQKQGGLPVFEETHINKNNDHEFTIWVPMLFSVCFHPVLSFVLQFFNHHLTEASFAPDKTLSAHIESLITMLKSHAPQGTNSLRFLKAANTENIPWRHVALNAFQYGYGKQSRWLDSTFTDKTSQITTILARNKRSMAVMLHNAGFPVAEQYVINSEAEALQMARRIGYPVVIKPLDQDGGKGVYARLVSEQSVKQAYQLAKKHSTNLLLEKHITGKDYRLLVLNGKLIWAIERIPAGVTGDGFNTIQALALKHNHQHEAVFPLRHIEITADTINYLAEQGFTLESVPPASQFVPLNRIANISTGGTPVGVFAKVHPDNIRLAETVAKLLRLDIAGVDFISPNIEQSYLENGGKLIEINSQPQLGSTTAPHIYKQILTTIVPDQGRIPIIVVCGQSIQDHTIRNLQETLFPQKQVGIAKNNCAYLDGAKIVSAATLFQAGQNLLALNEVDALIYCVEQAADIDRHGLPFDRYDSLYLLNGFHFGQSATLTKACRGEIIHV